ncbi:4-hydroxy-tetrahydrodipicolinate reductase [Bacillus mangrovi]|uniref:4-hydroxy-tetrahydrodipicolinate reductase n=1 Tax=Metabacillus mangrovi TaxID=1491830 RepID=A0A7X2S2E4_9BACI|nr:4-hydroxy-tetrahydrodipicolinate reductase [Metabacillus mangrovi]MTH52147.1 4-hydroxy-tetrahydrodipicolinate reductase [Metabacillus mangrovi]
MEQIKVVIAGPRGRMGREAVKLAEETPHFTLAGALDRRNGGSKLSEIGEGFSSEARIYEDIKECLFETNPDVLIDLTTPETGMYHAKTALEAGVRPVVGTTGFSEEDLKELRELAESRGLGAIIAPNFAVGAVLMMKFSQLAAKFFPDVEIIEQHHDRKLDAPSGTGLKTAEMISEIREEKQQGHPDEKETLEGARGASYNGIRIHSVRLPGLVAHQEVLFGGEGQTLKIRHDSYDRKSFMSGVRLSAEQVMKIETLVYGLENIIE